MHVLRVQIRRTTRLYTGRRSTAWSSTTCAGARPAYTSLEDLLETYDHEWRNEGFLTWAHEAARREAGRAAIRRFWHEEETTGTRPTFVERAFGVALPAPAAHPGARPVGSSRRDGRGLHHHRLQVLGRP
jgi:hypothetical protein